MIHRRCFLTLAAATPVLRGATFDKPIGINLYTVRDVLTQQPGKTYQALAGLGITRLELRENHLRDHADFIRQAGLQPVHMFVDSAVITGDWSQARKSDSPRPTLAGLAALAKQFGIRRLGLSYLMPGERPAAIAHINQAVETLDSLGLGFYYHNHAWEFEGVAGATFMDRLYRNGHPKLRLELDLFWATVGGEDVVRMLRQWKGRVASLHVKDVAPDAPRQKSEANMPRTAFKEVGSGILDWPRVLKAAADAGVEEYLVEQDFTPGDPIDSVRQSVAFLRKTSVG
jgi:sugar phosphate isomerase/epimerase